MLPDLRQQERAACVQSKDMESVQSVKEKAFSITVRAGMEAAGLLERLGPL